MSNNPVDPATGLPIDEEEEDTHTHSFQNKDGPGTVLQKDDAKLLPEGYIEAPKLSFLAKACLNIVGHQYEQQVDLAMTAHVQKKIQTARGPNTAGSSQDQSRV